MEVQNTSRRDALKLGATLGAGLAIAGLASSAEAAVPGHPDESSFKPSKYKHSFDFKQQPLFVDNAGGTIAICDQTNFPVVTGNMAAVFLLVLKPGGLREPHWHPNAWEMDIVLSGKVELFVVNPDATVDTVTLEPGVIGFIPQGYAHSIKNKGTEDATIYVVFNNSAPDDIGLSTMLGGMPKDQFAQTFGVPNSTLASIPKPPGTLYVAPPVAS